jgi:alkanesulfonate monooxygenase SsuD/methylene tetrahydromethanopterin reductase-like flavin-dependent oxidoreductase (luciferase family)
LKFGVYLPNFGAFGEARTLAELAHDAEAAGWDGFFIWDHIARPMHTPVVDAWVALSAIAMRTERVRIGALVTPLPRRRPWKLARETASLDRLSNGRLVLGVGIGSSGGQPVEWEAFGEELDLKKRGEMLDESLEIINGLWSGEPFAFNGKHYQVKESQFLPTPLQTPRIPVWVAGNWPHHAPFRRAARWDGMIPQTPAKGTDELAQLKEAIQFTKDEALKVSETVRRSDITRHAKERSDEASRYDLENETLRYTQDDKEMVLSDADSVYPFEVAFSGVTPGDDPPRAAENVTAYAEAGVTWWLEQVYPTHFGGSWQGDWPLEAMRRRILQGPPGRA